LWAALTGGEHGGPQKRPGVRLGPVYFVPQLRRMKGADPWAHRKGEPRPFALLWAMYLMVGALLTIFAVGSLTVPSVSQFQSGCRAMLEVMVVGMCGLWPMTRLSQRFPERAGRSLLLDAAVLLIPAQAVMWPMPLLTAWGWDVIAAVDLALIGWTLLVGGLLGLATGTRGSVGRTLWMGVIVGALGLGPGLMVALARTGRGPATEALGWLSPLTVVYRLTESPSGVRASMVGIEWLGALAPMGIAGLLWSLAPLSRPPPTVSPPSAHPAEAGTKPL